MTLITAPTYTTLAEFLLYTPRSTQRDGGSEEPTEDEWSVAGIEAQYIMDEHLNPVMLPPYDPDQDSILPTFDADGDEWYPDDLKLAHIHLTSFLLKRGDPEIDERAVSSKSYSGTGYAKTYEKSTESLTLVQMPNFVRMILSKYGANAAPATY